MKVNAVIHAMYIYIHIYICITYKLKFVGCTMDNALSVVKMSKEI